MAPRPDGTATLLLRSVDAFDPNVFTPSRVIAYGANLSIRGRINFSALWQPSVIADLERLCHLGHGLALGKQPISLPELADDFALVYVCDPSTEFVLALMGGGGTLTSRGPAFGVRSRQGNVFLTR